MKKIIKNIVFLATTMLAFPTFSQDVHFSQTDFSPLHLNPALAGGINDFSANVNYKTQWSSVATPYQTIAASVSSIVNPTTKPRQKVKLAVGIDFFNDWAGDANLMTNSIRLHFATHVRLAETQTLGLGVYGGYGMRTIDTDRMMWGSQYNGSAYDPNLSSGEQFSEKVLGGSAGSFDVGSGLFYRYSAKESRIRQNDRMEINAGFGAYHINRPKFGILAGSDERLNMRFSGFISGSFGIKMTKFTLDPAIYYHNQGPANELLLGSYVKYTFVEHSQMTDFVNEVTGSLGLFYRNLDALIIAARFDWHGLGVGISYDFNLFNSLIKTSKSRGGIEAMVRYVIPEFSRRGYMKGGRLLH